MEKVYADIIIDIAHEQVDRPFQYKIPMSMRESLKEGMCVWVPFGKSNHLRKGYVTAFKEKPEWDPDRIKEIASLETGDVSVEDEQIQLAAFLKRNYGSTMIQALKTVLPAKKTIKSVEKRNIRLLISKEECEILLTACEKKHQVAKVRLLRELLVTPSLPYSLVTAKLHVTAPTIKALEGAGAIAIDSKTAFRNPVKFDEDVNGQRLYNEDQQRIVDTVMADFAAGNCKTYLIHGITGSGKTEVYMNLIEEIQKLGRQAIVLIPEIALTYQTLLRFYRRFGDRVSVLNSSLSMGEKYDQCERAKRGEIDIMIGPRSALFTPFPNLGLIVMDEEQENSYKSESSPKYHAREVAIEIARMHHASVVLGSATPSMEAYFRARKGEYELFELKKRLTGGGLPKVHTVDLREELRAGNRSIFSRKLAELIQDRLQKKQQMMLFLNRRGYAGFVSCRACGHVMKCPHCDVSLSEHKGNRLVCHYCGYTQPAVKSCPACTSKYISGFRAGTQQIEEKLKEQFPGIRVLRMDADTTTKKDSYSEILSAFANGEADVLLGTQMIVKGHDFPNVTLVGILAADMSLSVGDYRASERTFQLLTQAVGRAGRGALPGEAVIQTYQPEHYSVVCAANQDYGAFYEEEILYREMLRYPPVCNMLAVQIFATKEEEGEAVAKELATMVREENGANDFATGLLVIGPTPAYIGKVQDVYRFVFYIKYENYDKLVEIKDKLEERVQEMQRKNVSMQIDFNPVNAF